MSIDDTRSFMVRVALICAFAAGAWHLLVRPLHNRADNLHAEIQAVREEIGAGEQVIKIVDQNPEIVLASLRDHAAAYRQWWAGPAPEARLYDSVRDIARAAGVQLVGVEPGRTQTRIISRDGENGDSLLRIESSTIDATGEFGPVLDLVDRIQRELGAVRVEAFQLGPFDGLGTLHIQINATRFIFERPFPSLQKSEVSP